MRSSTDLFQTGDLMAIGDRATTKNGKTRDILATTEVILAAGTIKSPQLLEISGIGDASLLKCHNIDVLIDNPNFGENLQDHGYVPFSWELADDQASGVILGDPQVAGAAMAAYQQAKAGLLSGVPIVSAFMPLVEMAENEVDELLCEKLDLFEHKAFPSQKEQFCAKL